MADDARVDHLAEYKALTRRLHDMELRGDDDPEEAERVRELCDSHWRAMTGDECDEADRYSEWLFDNVAEPGGDGA